MAELKGPLDFYDPIKTQQEIENVKATRQGTEFGAMRNRILYDAMAQEQAERKQSLRLQDIAGQLLMSGQASGVLPSIGQGEGAGGSPALPPGTMPGQGAPAQPTGALGMMQGMGGMQGAPAAAPTQTGAPTGLPALSPAIAARYGMIGRQAYGYQQMVMAQEQARMEQLDKEAGIIRKLEESIGLEGIRRNWNSIAPALKMLGKLDPSQLKRFGDGAIAYPVKDETGKQVGNRWATYDPKTKSMKTFDSTEGKHSMTSEGLYMEGLKRKLVEGGMDPREAEFQAADRVRKENMERQQTLINLRIPSFTSGGQNLPPGYVLNRRTGNYEWRGEGQAPGMSPEASLNWQALKKSIQTINNPVFKRNIANAEILADGVYNPATGKRGKPELDQVADLRDKIPDGVFGSLWNKVQKFNKWDQAIKYQFSDPDVARFYSKVMANVDTLASVYSGGGTVTSDFKMQFAKDLFEAGLSKESFRAKMDTHKESVKDRARRYAQLAPAGVGATPPVVVPGLDRPVETEQAKKGYATFTAPDGSVGVIDNKSTYDQMKANGTLPPDAKITTKEAKPSSISAGERSRAIDALRTHGKAINDANIQKVVEYLRKGGK